jgi:hypothetical protein
MAFSKRSRPFQQILLAGLQDLLDGQPNNR